MKLDVHIACMPYESPDRVADALRAQGANVYVVDAIEGDIAGTRALGYSRGQAELVTLADPDDDVAADAVSKILASAEDHPGLPVFTNEFSKAPSGARRFVSIRDSGLLINRLHHFAAYPRALANSLPIPSCGVGAEFEHARSALRRVCQAVYIDEPLYTWNVVPGGFHSAKSALDVRQLERELTDSGYTFYVGGVPYVACRRPTPKDSVFELAELTHG